MKLWTKDCVSKDEYKKGPEVQKKTPKILTKNWALTLLERGDLIGVFNIKASFHKGNKNNLNFFSKRRQ